MKSALGNAFIVNFIIVFAVIFITLFVGSTSYTKALRIKNRITDIIEENNGYDSKTTGNEITNYLSDVGYRISQSNSADCNLKGKTGYKIVYPSSTASNYDYCIYEYTNSKGTYYGVKTYMYLDVPLIGNKLKIGVYGETKTLGILGK